MGGSEVMRNDDALVFRGDLIRATTTALCKQMPSLAGVRQIDLTAVATVDSAGVALLAETIAGSEAGADIIGSPDGLDALRSAYRLDSRLQF